VEVSLQLYLPENKYMKLARSTAYQTAMQTLKLFKLVKLFVMIIFHFILKEIEMNCCWTSNTKYCYRFLLLIF